MTKVYTVKSNARRDARKRGLDPNLVVAVKGGFIISEPAAAPMSKGERLLAAITAGATMPELVEALGWQPHTVRGAISTMAKARGLKVFRSMVDGVPTYRVVT